MRLIEMEIARQDWKGMLCGCGGSAEHVAHDLLQLAGGGSRQELSHVSLEEHVWSPTGLWGPAPAVTSVALAALADDVAPTARRWFLELLQCMVAGEGSDCESARRGLDLPELCRNLAAQGLWLLVSWEKILLRGADGTIRGRRTGAPRGLRGANEEWILESGISGIPLPVPPQQPMQGSGG